MPHIRMETNISLDENRSGELVKKISAAAAEMTGKTEQYVQAVFRGGERLLFAGTSAPAAYIELKSIGLDPADCAGLSAKLCAFIQGELEIPPERVYIEFTTVKGELWGWNSGTF